MREAMQQPGCATSRFFESSYGRAAAISGARLQCFWHEDYLF
jgi:hypothetical protein